MTRRPLNYLAQCLCFCRRPCLSFQKTWIKSAATWSIRYIPFDSFIIISIQSLISLLVSILCPRFCALYSDVVKDHALCEPAKIQLYFDVVYMTRLCQGIWEGSSESYLLSIAQSMASLAALYKSVIDPIDFTLIHKHLAGCVEKHYGKTYALFGIFCLFNQRLPESFKISFSDASNVIAMASAPARFTLLPITSVKSAREFSSLGMTFNGNHLTLSL